MPVNKKPCRSKLKLPGDGLALSPFFSHNTKTRKVKCPGYLPLYLLLSHWALYSVVHVLEPRRAAMHLILQKNKFPAAKRCLHLHAFAHIANAFQSSTNASPENKRSSPQNSQTIHMQNQFEIKLFGSCCWRAKTTCESKQIPNSSPKTHSHKMLFSTKTSSTVIETLPDILASCRLPENSKNHLLHINHRSYLVKTKLKASAGHLI